MIPTSKRRHRRSFLFLSEQFRFSRPFHEGLVAVSRVKPPESSLTIDCRQNGCKKGISALPPWKRSSDILLILLILPIVAFFASLVYCWIQFVSPGTVLFRQTRIGRGGKSFTIYKFRSMDLKASTNVHEAHVEHLIKSDGPMVKLDVTGDSRLIKGGCMIRTSGLDELPQFINVLRGEMSLVGPRPCLPKEYELYDAHQRYRFAVQPGLTGSWQVNRTRSTTFSEMVKMDNEYVDNLTPMTDLKIILKTPLALLRQMKACAKSSPSRHAVIRSSTNSESDLGYALSMSSTQRISD